MFLSPCSDLCLPEFWPEGAQGLRLKDLLPALARSNLHSEASIMSFVFADGETEAAKGAGRALPKANDRAENGTQVCQLAGLCLPH